MSRERPRTSRPVGTIGHGGTLAAAAAAVLFGAGLDALPRGPRGPSRPRRTSTTAGRQASGIVPIEAQLKRDRKAARRQAAYERTWANYHPIARSCGVRVGPDPIFGGWR